MDETFRVAACNLMRENEDGSAVFTFDFTKEEQEALLRLGIMTAIQAGLDEAKKYHPDYDPIEKTIREQPDETQVHYSTISSATSGISHGDNKE